MSTHISLINFTEQGTRDIRATVSRFHDAEKLLQSMGGKIIGCWWILGQYDQVAVFEAPDDAVAANFIGSLVRLGNVRTNTMRCFSAEEITKALGGSK